MTSSDSDPVVYLDANVFILFLEGASPISEPLRELFSVLRTRRLAGVTSELTLAEVLVGPEQASDLNLKRSYLDLIVWSRFIALQPVNRSVLYESARLRAVHVTAHQRKLKLPDAIHLVTSMRSHCRFFVSADQAIGMPTGMTRLLPVADDIDRVLKALT